MLSLSRAQLEFKRQERQVVDLRMATQLMDAYDGHTTFMSTLREMCVVGIDLALRGIDDLSALAGTDLWADKAFMKTVNGDIGFLDCFAGKPITRALLEEMQRFPDKWFATLAMVGGWFRGHAELSEISVNYVFYTKKINIKAAVTELADAGKSPAGAIPADFAGDAAARTALTNILVREYEGRLSHQRKLIRTGVVKKAETSVGGDSVLHDVYSYSAEWMQKFQHKGTVDELAAKLTAENRELQRARRKRSFANEDNTVPAWIRPFIRRPTHIDSSTDSYKGTGIRGWVQMEWDRLWTIAQLYGLPPGATISGTTTDHMFVIYEILTEVEKRAAPSSRDDRQIHMAGLARRMNEYLPYFHLIPVAQMGSQFHHAICEMATALSLNDFISYHVGHYSSLLPTASQMRVVDTQFDATVRGIFSDAEGQVSHLYGMSMNCMPTDISAHAAWCVDPRKPAEVEKHRRYALLDPESATADFRSIPAKIDASYILKMAKRIDPSCATPS